MTHWGALDTRENTQLWARIYQMMRKVNTNVVQRMMGKMLPKLRAIKDYRPLSVLWTWILYEAIACNDFPTFALIKFSLLIGFYLWELNRFPLFSVKKSPTWLNLFTPSCINLKILALPGELNSKNRKRTASKTTQHSRLTAQYKNCIALWMFNEFLNWKCFAKSVFSMQQGESLKLRP